MKNLQIRLPEDLLTRLRALAEHEHRSMNAQLLHLIEGATAHIEDTHPPQETP